jgi:hypothetical protein
MLLSCKRLTMPSFWKPAAGDAPFTCSVFYLGTLITFAMLCLLRGWTPRYEAQSFFHKTDLISLASILEKGSYPPETIFFQFAKTLSTFSLGLWGYRHLIEFGVTPETLYLATTYLQIAAFAIGTSLIAYAFRPIMSHIALTCGVVFFGVFFVFGRYLNLDGAFWESYSSGHALSIGLVVVGLLLNKFDRSAVVVAAAVALYHPSHGLVAVALVAATQIWRLGGDETDRLRQVVFVALIATALFVPIYSFYFVMIPRLDVSVDEWWTMAVAVQRVMTPLADGIPVAVGLLVAGLLTIALLSCREFESLRETAGRARVVAGVVLLLLLLQCFTGDFAHLTRIAQLCLTRSQPYMAIISGAALVAIARLWWEGSSPGATDPSADRIAAIIVVTTALVPPLRLPNLIPQLVQIDTVTPLMVLDQWRCVLVLSAALYWSLRRNAESKSMVLHAAYICFVVGYVLLLGLRVEVISSAALLALTNTPYSLPARSLFPKALTVAFVIVAALSLQKRPGWSAATLTRDEADNVIREHVEKGSMILVVPQGYSDDIIHLLPDYSEFLAGYEAKFTLYAPWLTSLTLERLTLQGINPLDYKAQCRNPLLFSRCLYVQYAQATQRRDDTWRTNLKRMTELSPRLTYVFILRRYACKDDKPQAETSQFVLVQVGDVAPAGCT